MRTRYPPELREQIVAMERAGCGPKEAPASLSRRSRPSATG